MATPGDSGKVTKTRAQERAARRLIRATTRATLATLNTDASVAGWPYASLVAAATDHDGTPILLMSDLADHTRHIGADPRVALFFDDAAGLANPQTGPRVTLMGRLRTTGLARHRARYLARNPGAALYADFADFHFYALEVERAHFVGGFARAAWMGPVTVASGAAALMAEAEGALIERLNDRGPAAIDLMANVLLGQEGAGYRLTAADVDGIDLGRGDRVTRLAFESPVGGPEEAEAAFAALAEKAKLARSAGEG